MVNLGIVCGGYFGYGSYFGLELIVSVFYWVIMLENLYFRIFIF